MGHFRVFFVLGRLCTRRLEQAVLYFLRGVV